MSEIITIAESERQIWDEFVAQHKFCHYTQSYEWGELKRVQGWNPIRLGVKTNGNIVAGIAMLEKKLPLIGKSVFYAPRGPLISLNDYGSTELLMEGIKGVALRQKAIFLRVDPYEYEKENGHSEVKDMLLRLGFFETGMNWSTWNLGRVTQIINLPSDCGGFLASLNQKVRRYIRLPYKKGATVVEDASESNLREFYGLLKDTAGVKGFATRDYHHFKTFCSEFARSNSSKLFVARFNGVPIAGSLCIKFGKVFWGVYGATNRNFSDLPASYSVQWEEIRTAIKEGCDIYDFGGTPVSYPPKPSDAGYGVYEFKKKFSGELVRLVGYFDLIFNPLWYRVFIGAEQYIMPRVYVNYTRYKNMRNFLEDKLIHLLGTN